jgi:hypothetical protein
MVGLDRLVVQLHMSLVVKSLALALLLFVSALPVAPASHDDTLKTEWLPFLATNSSAHAGVSVSSTPCDQLGIGGARFCATLQDPDSRPDRLLIDIRDEAGLRVGGFLQFRDADGAVLPANQGGTKAFCGAVNHYVHPEAATLTVLTRALHPHRTEVTTPGYGGAPSVTVGANHNMLCGSPGTLGKVTVVWRYNATVDFPY